VVKLSLINSSPLSLGWHYNILTELSQDGKAYGKILTVISASHLPGRNWEWVKTNEK
jgi:hypothetical protein